MPTSAVALICRAPSDPARLPPPGSVGERTLPLERFVKGHDFSRAAALPEKAGLQPLREAPPFLQ